MLSRLRRTLAAALGVHYAAAVQIADRAALAFFAPFLARLVGGDVLRLDTLLTMAWWKAAALAGVAAALAVVQSTLTVAITGTPEALSLVSRTLRYRRDLGARPQHHVPLRPEPRRRPLPYPHPKD